MSNKIDWDAVAYWYMYVGSPEAQVRYRMKVENEKKKELPVEDEVDEWLRISAKVEEEEVKASKNVAVDSVADWYARHSSPGARLDTMRQEAARSRAIAEWYATESSFARRQKAKGAN